jgi:hypothetical protein
MLLSSLAGVLLLALAVQLAALWRMGGRRAIGDELGYLERGGSQDPLAPRQFLRVPLLPWLAAFCRGSAPLDVGERRLRLLMSAAGILTVVVTAIAGWQLGGPAVALLGALLLAVQPERVLLGCHLWPDTLLALVLAGQTAVSALPASPAVALIAGGLCTLGVLTRIDFLVVPPLLLAAWRVSQGPLSALTGWAVIGPPLLALALVTIRNGRRYGVWLPDDTWAFNLMVARSEARLVDEGRFAIEPAVADAVKSWRDLTHRQAPRQGLGALWENLRSPHHFGRGIARRILTLVGPDTFLRQKVLPRDAAYPDLADRWRRRWDAALRIAFPLLAATVLISGLAGPRLPGGFAWPTLGLLAVAVLFHARTRYRVTALPALSLVAAQGIVRCRDLLEGRPLAAALLLGAGAVLFWALLRIRCSAELRP